MDRKETLKNAELISAVFLRSALDNCNEYILALHKILERCLERW